MPVRVLRAFPADRLVQADNDTRSKKALRSIFGLHSSTSTDISTITASPSLNHITTESRSAQSSKEKEKFGTVKERSSVDVASTGSGSSFVSLSHRQGKPQDRNGRASVADVSFFQQTSTPSTLSLKPTDSLVSAPESHRKTTAIDLTSPSRKSKMTRAQEMPLERATRRKLVRIDAQEGPWSVSVAESPYDRSNYSIYIKTLTHHMTLTRSGQEILALHRKLVSAHPELTLPDLPLRHPDENVEAVLTDKKRKSSFLHTLSRFTTPGPNRRDRPKDVIVAHPTTSSRTSMANGGQPETPISMTTSATLPSKESETWDLYASSLTASDANSALSTALAGYLTALANEPALKHSKAWRRFVRIRADDLISERIERAVKRVRSDLAAHLSAAKFQPKKAEMRDDASLAESAVLIEPERDQDIKESSHTSGVIENIKEEEEEDVATAENIPVKKDEEIESAAQDLPGTPRPSDTTRNSLDIPESVSTPTETNATIASRIPRSQSADPDKATRMSRLLQLSSMRNDGDESAAEYESEAQIETEVEEGRSTTTADDDSSLSTTDRQRRPKRSKSARLRERAKKAKEAKKVAIDDFDMMRVLGKGCAGKVLLVRHRKSENIYALKAITKRHVLAHQELQHTLTEQAVLKRMAREGKDPFVVKLWWSFHDKENLYLVMDFHPGGDLATQLARWGRLGRDRARFYAAEIVEGVDGLHAAGVIYRDLKPENILIGADGHIVLTDFGLSKEFPRRTSPITAPATPSGSRTDFHAQQPLPHWMKGEENKAVWPIGQADSTMTFCGTAEYLAPEVIQGEPYSYEVDWWSFGTMLFEMLTGITPFWADNHADMYCRVLKDELRFPSDRVLDQDTKSLIRGLLQRNPALRIRQPRIKRHPYFSMIDWSHVYYKRYIPPYIPPIDPLNASDTQNFDDTFLGMEPIIDDPLETGEDAGATNDKTNGEDAGASSPEQQKVEAIQMLENRPDLFDGYSFKGRHSVLIEDENEEGEYPEEDEPNEEETDEEEDIQRLANMDVGQEVDGIEPGSEAEEPKTPEAKMANLPELTPAEEIAALHRAAMAAAEVAEEVSTPVKEVSATQPTDVPGKKVDGVAIEDGEPEGALSSPQTPVTPQAASPARQPATEVEPKPVAVAVTSRVPPARSGRPRREKSGIHALDQYLSDAGDDELTERDEDDDWDFVEALPVGAEDHNGAKGTSLFARGVVDRYRLAVFRKSSTPSKNTQRRNTSGTSFVSDMSTSDVPSPSPSDKQRRGRNAGLTFRRHPKQFLKKRSSPPSAYPNGSSKILTHQSTANTIFSASSSNGGILSPASSTQVSTTTGPSLKSKQSTTSVGSPSSDDQSLNGDGPNPASSADVLSSGQQSPDGTVRTITTDEPDKPKSKKLKKYKEGAEKMLSIFASPR